MSERLSQEPSYWDEAEDKRREAGCPIQSPIDLALSFLEASTQFKFDAEDDKHLVQKVIPSARCQFAEMQKELESLRAQVKGFTEAKALDKPAARRPLADECED